jgi:outer membrane protein
LFFSLNGHAATLDEAFRSALQKNEVVLQSREKVVQAEEQVNIAKSAPYPTLSFEYDHMYQDLPTSPFARQFTPENQVTSNFRLKQPLFKGFREWAALRQRKDLLNAGKEERVQTMLVLYENVASAYLNVLALEQDLKNLNELAEIYGARVKELRGRARRGESASHEVLTIQSNEAVVLSDISLVSANLRSARENLNFLTGLPADVPVTDRDEKTLALKPLGEYLGRLEERPDVKAARERLAAAQEEVSFSKGAHWPSLDLTGNYYLQRPGFFSDIDWDLQLHLSFPLFEGGLRLAETRESSSREREATLELAKIRRSAESQIRALHENLKLREGQLKALQNSTELSQKTYQALQREYRRGLTRNVDVQMALTNYGLSRRTFDQARYAARLDRIKLESAAVILPPSLEGSLK